MKRALEVAAAEAHNMIMVGPPGVGKTLLARSMPSILPRLTIDEALDITHVYSVAEVYGWFTEGFDTPDLQKAKALLEGLSRQ